MLGSAYFAPAPIASTISYTPKRVPGVRLMERVDYMRGASYAECPGIMIAL